MKDTWNKSDIGLFRMFRKCLPSSRCRYCLQSMCMLEVLVFEFLAESQRFHKFVPFIDGVIGLPWAWAKWPASSQFLLQQAACASGNGITKSKREILGNYSFLKWMGSALYCMWDILENQEDMHCIVWLWLDFDEGILLPEAGREGGTLKCRGSQDSFSRFTLLEESRMPPGQWRHTNEYIINCGGSIRDERNRRESQRVILNRTKSRDLPWVQVNLPKVFTQLCPWAPRIHGPSTWYIKAQKISELFVSSVCMSFYVCVSCYPMLKCMMHEAGRS